MATPPDPINSLTAARNKLTAIIARTNPQSPADQDGLDKLVAMRDRVSGAINAVIEQGFSASVADLAKVATQLEQLNGQLDGAANRLDATKTGLEIASKALAVIAQVVSFVV